MASPTERIDAMITGLPDWRGQRLANLRRIINEAGGLREDWKWNSPTWTSKRNVLSLGAFKEHVKVNFFKGASLDDPKGLFNAGLEAKETRSIDLREGDAVDEAALKALIREAVERDAM